MESLKYLALFLMIIFGWGAFSQPGSYYPPPANVIYHNDTLIVCPPDSLPGDPVILVGYNIYVDSVFFDNVPVTDPSDTINYIFTFPALPPGDHLFCANAVYNQWISDQACDSATVIYGYELPFLEGWSTGSFEELKWTSSSGNWVISNEEGNPAPAAEFRGDPTQTNYAINLESYPINAFGITVGNIWLDFNVKLNCIHPTGKEKLRILIWNWANKVWTSVGEWSNEEGNFTWKSDHIPIKSQAINKVFKIRFQATGLNSADIQGWYIDNIQLYRACDAASNLALEEHTEYNELFWLAIWGPCPPNDWIHWDDGVNSGVSIGTGGAAEFDVAARWEPAMLVDFQGSSIHQVAFFPSEETATYSIRIWTGSNPDTMVVDQSYPNPIIGEWNTVSLTTPFPLDITKDLWVGYHIITPTGYPAGVDDGPAIDGYGNMMFWEGAWTTLLEINPDLDYNWNIAFHLSEGPWPEPEDVVYFKIYRQRNNEEFQFYGTSETIEFLDNNIDLADHYCYKVTMVSSQYSDTCESDPTNTVCETQNVGIDQPERDNTINIYPNPANNWLNIESEEEIREIRMYDLLGEEVLKLENGNLEARVDVSRLQSGIYYINVTTIGKEYKAKIVILR